MASERVRDTLTELYDLGRDDGRRDAAAEIASLTRELEAALERERRLLEALLTLLTAVDAARNAIAKATGKHD